MHVSAMVTRGVAMEMILEEIAKCDLVCANCHRMRTWTRGKTRGKAKARTLAQSDSGLRQRDLPA